MDDPKFVFEGFLPRRAAKRRRRLQELASDTRPLVLFESPHRLLDCLTDMIAALGDRRCVVAREITKLHEDIVKGRLSAVIDRFTASQPRGEFVIVCEGATVRPVGGITAKALEEAESLVKGGMKKHKAARTVAKRYGVKASDLYDRMKAERRDSGKGSTT
jgi:16S rRNA (cytidine1402-2'-O)-methyltransferase